MKQKKRIKSICVFCGSRYGLNPKYKEAAIELGHIIAKKNLTLKNFVIAALPSFVLKKIFWY